MSAESETDMPYCSCMSPIAPKQSQSTWVSLTLHHVPADYRTEVRESLLDPIFAVLRLVDFSSDSSSTKVRVVLAE